MKYILLAGFSQNNRIWAGEFVEAMRPYGYEFKVFEYTHWQTGDESDFIVETEVERLGEFIGEDEYVLVAKSIGTFVSAHYFITHGDLLQQLVWLGVCLHALKDDEKAVFGELFEKYPELSPTVIQNHHDPLGNHHEVVANFTGMIDPESILMEERNDHYYPCYERVAQVLSQ